jgi:GNAT superfamily N-acetyltransferase
MMRVLRREDIDGVVPLLRAAYGRDAPYRERLSRYLAIEPLGWFVADDGGGPAGLVGVTVHKRAAYIGLMAVDPAQQRRGHGARLMEQALAFIAGRGIGSVMLDASVAGAPLYERYGFVDRGLTHDLVYDGPERRGPARVASVEDVLALDRASFGADRAATLRVFAEEGPGRLVVAREGGDVSAYALAQRTLIGPVVAKTREGAEEVISAALTLPFDAPPHVLAPGSQTPVLEALGFKALRSLRHMRRGAPEIAYQVVGKASLAVG